MPTRIFNIIGEVVDRATHCGAAGLRIEAWDKDLIHDDHIGSTVTDTLGGFTITFTDADFRDLFGDRQPDLYFKVFRGAELIKSTEDSVLWNVAAATIPVTIEVNLPVVPPTEPVNDDLIAHRIAGRLLDQKTGKPLPRYVVHAFDLDADSEPKDLGYDLTDAKGLFTVTYTTKRSPRTMTSPATGRRLRLHILDRQKKEIHRTEIRTHANPRQIVEVRIPVPEVIEPPSPSLREVAEKSKLKIPPVLLDALAERGIRTLTDVRQQGGLAHVKGLPVPEDDPALRLFDAHVSLGMISTDIELNEWLIVDKGYRSIGAIARAPREDFVAAAIEKAGHFKAAQMHVKAKAQTRYLSNVLMGLKADWANGLPVRLKGITNPHIPDWFRHTCECKDCESAVSPQAYLADLLDYAVLHLWNDDRAVDIPFLAENFHQPFDELSTSCEAASEQVRQVRLCIEVLRADGRRPAQGKQENYCLAAYTDLLTRLGTSYQELRLARGAGEEKRHALAERLGIGVEHLDALRLEPQRMTEHELEGLFGLRDTAAEAPWRDTPGPALIETWRLDYLRELWRQQDWPRDAYVEAGDADGEAGLLPVIDPDLIGPDDFRRPERKGNDNDPDQPFDIWLRRRQWVDRQLADFAAARNDQGFEGVETLLARMGRPLADDYPNVTPWTPVPTPQALEYLAQDLGAGTKQEAEDATRIVEDALHLKVDSFTRLMAIRAKHRDFRDGIGSEPVTEEEWSELSSILVQAQKAAVFPAWRQEERAWREARNVRTLLGPRDFWFSLREPEEGDWPPLKPAANPPWIDPDLVRPEDLPEPTIGGRAMVIWNARREQINEHIDELRRDRRGENGEFDPLVQAELGQTPEWLAELETELDSGEADRVQSATREIESTLHLTVEEFRRLRELRAKGERMSADDWEELHRILTRAVKERVWIREWFEIERDEEEGMNANAPDRGEYWRALKARQPRWRASAGARQRWQQALRVRSQPPIVDPDLIDSGRLLDAFNGPAVSMWLARKTWVDLRCGMNNQLGEIEGARVDHGLDWVLEQILGVQPDTLNEIAGEGEDGSDIAPRVAQLNLTLGAFRYLQRIRSLPANEVLASEWQDTCDILFQVEKRRLFAEWRQEEQDDKIVLAPDPFKLPELLAFEFPPPEPPPLPAWRATRRDLQDWDQRLQSRIDQRQAAIDGLRSLVSNAEAACLPLLRDYLVDSIRILDLPEGDTGARRAAKAKWFADHRLIDASAGGCQMTTRITQAIETLQGILWSARTGQFTDPDLDLRAPDFDEEWRWIGSYATWRAVMFVCIFPENLLHPSLKQHQTPGFRGLANELRSANGRLTPERACTLAASYYDYFEDVCNLNLKASREALTRVHKGSGCHRQAGGVTHLWYLFGQPEHKTTVYWSFYDMKDGSGYAQSFWDAVPGLTDVTLIIGAQPYAISEQERFLFLFVRTEHAGQQKLMFTRYNLEYPKWDGEPKELELPEGTVSFEATIIRRNQQNAPPWLRILAGGLVYERQLNGEGSAWADDYWRPMDHVWGSWSQLPTPQGVSFTTNTAVSAVSRGNQAMYVFLVGNDRRAHYATSADGTEWHIDTLAGEEQLTAEARISAVSLNTGQIQLFTVSDASDEDDERRVRSNTSVNLLENDWDGWQEIGVYREWIEQVPFNPPRNMSEWIPVLRSTLITTVRRDLEQGYALHLFVVGDDGRVYTTVNADDGSWERGSDRRVLWMPAREVDDFPPGSGITAFYRGQTYISLFSTRGEAHNEGGVWGGLWDTDRKDWALSARHIGTDTDIFHAPSAVTAVYRAGQLELYVVNEAGIVRTTSSRTPDDIDSWAAWSSISDPEQVAVRKRSTITTVKSSGDHVDLFAIGEDGVVYGTWSDPDYNEGEWNPWYPIGLSSQKAADEQTSIAALSYGGEIHLFVVGAGGGIYHNATEAWRVNDPRTVPLPDDYRHKPQVAEPFRMTAPNSALRLQGLRDMIADAFHRNAPADDLVPRALWNLAYLEEAYYFVPLQIAMTLQSAAQYMAALDWFRTVYDYGAEADPEADGDPHKIAYVLARGDAQEDAGFERADDWLLDPLNPHSIAITRPGAYTRFTLMALVRCLLEYADAEFTRDTAESVPRARVLYTTALELLDLPELKRRPGCDDPPLRLPDDLVEDPLWQGAWKGIVGDLYAINERFSRFDAIREVMSEMRGGNPEDGEGVLPPLEERLAGARRVVDRALASQPSRPTLGVVVAEKAGSLDLAHEALLGYDGVARGAGRTAAIAGRDFLHALSLVTGFAPVTLQDKEVEIPFLDQRMMGEAGGPGLAPDALGGEAPVWKEYEALTVFDPFAPTRWATLARMARRRPGDYIDQPWQRGAGYHPDPWPGFCIPRNPVLEALRLHADLNLYKIRTCRNIAGMERQLEPYAAPTDTVSGLPMISADGQSLILPGTVALQPTPYRYSALIERAKQLVQLAAQIEAAMLAALEKRDAEAYSELKARQDISLARAGITLQDLRVREAEGGVALAELQKERAQIQVDTYDNWINEDTNAWEDAAIALMYATIGLHAAAAAAAVAEWKLSSGSQAFSSLAAGTSTLASIFSIYADNERRRQGWEFEKSLAEQEVRIGSQQIRIDEDHVRVAGQERLIAKMQAEHATDTLEFLTNEFTNVELYDWMSNVLEGVYSFFLQRAMAMARLAENQLAFERQEAPVSFIQADYWEAPSDAAIAPRADGRGPDRRGLTGSARLLQDVYQLDQHAFETAKRKLQLSKTISLARLAPFEFQRFRETGVITLRTPMELFDRDFPGHYLRLIHKVRTSVVALIPPTEGIRATLSATGISRVVIGPEVFQTVVVRRPPESVALTSHTNASGLFELEAQSEMLLPFESMGVDTAWEFRMPKGANLFDYRTIADVLLTIEYTALHSFDYQQQVFQTLSPDFSADRPFSFRHQFADPWYDLHNPDQTSTPMTVRFETVREDFPPNLDSLRIEHVVLYFARNDGQASDLPATMLNFTERGAAGSIGGAATPLEGVISTRRGNAGSWMAMIGKAPTGTWELSLPNTQEVRTLFKDKQIEDILLVITFAGRTPAWPA